MKNRKKGTLGQASTWLNLSVVGIQFPIAILLGYWIGSKLDILFGTAPYLKYIFLLFGIAAGFLNLFRMTAEATRREEQELRRQAEQEQAEQRTVQHSNGEDSNGEDSNGEDSGGER